MLHHGPPIEGEVLIRELRGCRRNPEAPDYMGDMNPFWQSLDSVFGQYFNATVNETDSDYTTFFHPVRRIRVRVIARVRIRVRFTRWTKAASRRPCCPLRPQLVD